VVAAKRETTGQRAK